MFELSAAECSRLLGTMDIDKVVGSVPPWLRIRSFDAREPWPCCHHVQAYPAPPILFLFPQDGEVDFSEFLACLLDWSKVHRAGWQCRHLACWTWWTGPPICRAVLDCHVFLTGMFHLLVFFPCSCNSRTSGWAWWTGPTSRWIATAAAASGPRTWRSCCAAKVAARCAFAGLVMDQSSHRQCAYQLLCGDGGCEVRFAGGLDQSSHRHCVLI